VIVFRRFVFGGQIDGVGFKIFRRHAVLFEGFALQAVFFIRLRFCSWLGIPRQTCSGLVVCFGR
jgi:hypothetical protein